MRSTTRRLSRAGSCISKRALEDLAEQPPLLAQLLEDVTIVEFEVLAVAFEEALPTELGRHHGRLVVGRLRALVGHLQEQEQGDLLGVGVEGQAGVAQDVGVAPRLVDYALGVAVHC